ncbi:unnamed protein product [Protopolystoma xenopodis]|uniref:Macro domain-containing protein n=1 Tax=Protopolystoma xenopodis TaxID=117903 RepID=A0A3S5AF28_9PLAT|nr:unnamed protein product [Protopolystoma xenopodis]
MMFVAARCFRNVLALTLAAHSLRPQISIAAEYFSTSARDRYTNMTLEEKKAKCECNGAFACVHKIPSWKIYSNSRINNPLADRISLWKGDITTLKVDAIVNAANKHLKGGGGVDGAIHRAAGPLLHQECLTLNGCKTGSAKITAGYNLPKIEHFIDFTSDIIHCVGPVGENSDALASCYQSAFQLCMKHGLKTVAFPCISTGIYG